MRTVPEFATSGVDSVLQHGVKLHVSNMISQKLNNTNCSRTNSPLELSSEVILVIPIDNTHATDPSKVQSAFLVNDGSGPVPSAMLQSNICTRVGCMHIDMHVGMHTETCTRNILYYLFDAC